MTEKALHKEDPKRLSPVQTALTVALLGAVLLSPQVAHSQSSQESDPNGQLTPVPGLIGDLAVEANNLQCVYTNYVDKVENTSISLTTASAEVNVRNTGSFKTGEGQLKAEVEVDGLNYKGEPTTTIVDEDYYTFSRLAPGQSQTIDTNSFARGTLVNARYKFSIIPPEGSVLVDGNPSNNVAIVNFSECRREPVPTSTPRPTPQPFPTQLGGAHSEYTTQAKQFMPLVHR